MQTILAAITNVSCPAPPVIAKPKTEMQNILAPFNSKSRFGKCWGWCGGGSGGSGSGDDDGGGNQNNNNNNTTTW